MLFSRADRRREAQHQAADVRIRCRRGCGGLCPRRPLPRRDRGRCRSRAAARFFAREDRGYRVMRELRDAIVFTVQNLLTDAPFSRLDLVSCRNLLIYLQADAQEKVLSVLHFALREEGVPVPRRLRDRRQAVRSLRADFPIAAPVIAASGMAGRARRRSQPGSASARAHSGRASRAGWSRDAPASATSPSARCSNAHAPAAVLVNRKHRGLYFFGPTDRYLPVAAGEATRDCSPWRATVSREAPDRDPARARATRASASGAPASGATATSSRSASRPSRCCTTATSCCSSASSTNRGARSCAQPRDAGRTRACCRTRAGTRSHAEGTREHDPRPRSHQPGTHGDQRRGDVGQRGVPVDQRGAGNVEGGAAVAQRRAHHAQQPAARDGRATAQDRQRPAEHREQHRRRDPVPRREPQHPVLHAGRDVAVQHHRLRRRPTARRSRDPLHRHRFPRRCPHRAGEPRDADARDPQQPEHLVFLHHLAVPALRKIRSKASSSR